MSSLFAARIIVGLLARQTATGVVGHAAEIGVFEGRLLIAMALALAEGERAVAIDPFTWPDPGVGGRFEANCAAHGVPAGRLVVLQGDSRSTTPMQLVSAAGGGAGPLPPRRRRAHGRASGQRPALGRRRHGAGRDRRPRRHAAPGYPTLALTVHAFLDAAPDWRVLAIIDREDIVGAAKYLLCRKPAVAHYEKWLCAAFAAHVWPLGADFGTYRALVLTPDPKLADVG
jgi:hypothetical protein